MSTSGPTAPATVSLPIKATDVALAKQDAYRTALAAAAGVGAAVTLGLAFRRQRHQEHAAHVTTYLSGRTVVASEHDAIERRVTDLYTKAVELLGSEKAAVRLGGLYALERLAQDHVPQRQAIVNVICAYLRMPYASPPLTFSPDSDQQRSQEGAATLTISESALTATDYEGERQVRVTAQRILSDHLRNDSPAAELEDSLPGDERFWPDIYLDLSGATLIDLDFRSCRIARAEFNRANFIGMTFFTRTHFSQYSRFEGATFRGPAHFSHATFTNSGRFNGATFISQAYFKEASFNRNASFDGVTFGRLANFRRTLFRENASFAQACFIETADMYLASFGRVANFHEAFGAENIDLQSAHVNQPGLEHLWPPGWRLKIQKQGKAVLWREGAS